MNSLAHKMPDTLWSRGKWTVRATREVDEDEVKSVERPTRQRDRVVARLRTLSHYGHGWDGEQARAPLPKAIDDAINVVAHLTRDFPFQAALEPDGSVELIARGSRRKVILVLEGTGSVGLFVIEPNREPELREFPVPSFIRAGRALEMALGDALE